MAAAAEKPPRSARRGWRYWRKLLLLTLTAVLFAVYGVMPVVFAIRFTRPARVPLCCETPADRGLEYQNVTFGSADGLRLSGWYIPTRNSAAVILTHGYGGNRVEMLSRAEMLARQGYGVLLYDMRASGDSEGDLGGWGWTEERDVLGALAYLQSRDDVDPVRIGALGFSVGAEATLRAAAQNDGIAAVILDGCPSGNKFYSSNYRSAIWIPFMGVMQRAIEMQIGVAAPPAPEAVIPSIGPRPLLIIATGGEALMGRELYTAAQDPAELWEIPEAGHGGGPAARPQEYAERIGAFFDRTLLDGQL